jgi:hypothetical protein
MGSSQLMLVLGGILLFSYLVLSFQSTTNQNYDLALENEAVITAAAIGQSFLEKIQVKAFDENTVSSEAKNPSQLSSYLGVEGGEFYEYEYDDIDDYDAFQDSVMLKRLGNFYVVVDVYYVNRSNPGQISGSATFSKRIDVEIDNIYLKDPLQLNSIVSY